ncbi:MULTISPECIES: hypothetical protein, partial [unclassified Empedobacter]|uniref:hypothetical protein n=1 Tax=unclassified Empedobacter TaxID=2643773 RepID=UPI0025B9C66F
SILFFFNHYDVYDALSFYNNSHYFSFVDLVHIVLQIYHRVLFCVDLVVSYDGHHILLRTSDISYTSFCVYADALIHI